MMSRGAPPAAARLRAALSGSSILPSDTSVRFASLVGMVFATTVVIYLRLWLDHLASDDTYQACAAGLSQLGPASLLPGSSLDAVAPLVAEWVRCGKPSATTALAWALGGVSAVAGVAAIAYLALPRWRISRRRLQPLDRVRSPALHAHLDDVVKQIGLAARPAFWLAPEPSAQGVAFGRQARCHVQLNAGLIKKFHTNRSAVTAVVLHELAHVRNRDIRYTYLTITIWWAFVLVALLPYALTSILPLVLGSYPQWWPASVRASSVNGRVVVSVLAMTALTYLVYAAILRVRETHADATAASAAGDDALRQVLAALDRPQAAAGFWRKTRRLRQGWAVLRTHPSVGRRLAILGDPTPLYSTATLEMVGAGIAIAVVQANLANLTGQALIAWAPADARALSAAGYSVGYSLASLATYGVSTALIAALACVTMWRERLRSHAHSSPPRRGAWLRPAAALSAGLLVGEPLSVFYGTQHVWGVFDGIGVGGAGVAGVVGAAMSAAALAFGVAVLFAWMSECAAVWIPVARGSLRRLGLVASVVGALAFAPAYAAWSWTHDTGFVLTVLSYFEAPQEWASAWAPPGMSLVYADYLPIFLVCMVPGIGVMLALPWLFVVVGAARRPPSAIPRWLRSAGPAAAGGAPPPRQQRIPVGAAMRTGLAGGLACLVGALGLATLVWDRTARSGLDIVNAKTYLSFATPALAVAFSAVSAAVVAARAQPAAGTLAALAAFVTSGLVAVATPVVAGVGMCGPSDVLARAECRDAVAGLTPALYGYAMVIGVPRAVFAACLASVATAAVSRLARVPRLCPETEMSDASPPGDVRPSRLRRAVLIASTGAIVANLAVGGYVGHGLVAAS
jgi:Zn-dependent protease with chaperone function